MEDSGFHLHYRHDSLSMLGPSPSKAHELEEEVSTSLQERNAERGERGGGKKNGLIMKEYPSYSKVFVFSIHIHFSVLLIN